MRAGRYKSISAVPTLITHVTDHLAVVLTTLVAKPRRHHTQQRMECLRPFKRLQPNRQPRCERWGSHLPLRQGRAIRVDQVFRAVGCGRDRAVGRSVGDSYDNALAGTINGLYKAEVIHRRGPWRNFEVAEFATIEWVDLFNHRHLLEPIGNNSSRRGRTTLLRHAGRIRNGRIT